MMTLVYIAKFKVLKNLLGSVLNKAVNEGQAEH